MEFDRGGLKRSVKLSMKSTSPNPVLVALLFSVVVSAGTWLINLLLGWLLTGGVGDISATVWYYMQQGYDVDDAAYIAILELFRMGPGAIFGATVGAAVLSVIVSLWSSTMNVGYEGWCLSMVRNENPPMGKLFGALPQFVPVFITRFLTGVFEALWMLLLCVGLFALLLAAMALAAVINSNVLLVILMVAVFAVFWLGGMWVMLRYALVDYALLDKGLSGLDAIRESKRLMKGNIGKGFVLQLSFIGWYLLMFAIIYGVIIAAAIPIALASSTNGLMAASGAAVLMVVAALIGVAVLTLWLKPYTTGSWAKFYDWAKGQADGFSHGPSFGGGAGGWSEHTDYTWNAGPTSGTGTGYGSGSGGANAPKPPKTPRDDPWN